MGMPGSGYLTRLMRNRVALAGTAIAIVAAIIVVAVVALASDSEDGQTAVVPTATASPAPSPSPQATLEPSPTPIPVVPGTNAGDRLVIEKVKIDAPITLKAVPAGGGALPSPNGPDDVVFYDFAAFPGLGGYPGSGGRIVLSGHVDYGSGYCKNGTMPPPCTAVFWDLSDLKEGDVVELRLSNGVHKYRVTGSDNLGATDQTKWDEIWKAGSGETIALITCGGDFNRVTREYDKRHVIYGELI